MSFREECERVFSCVVWAIICVDRNQLITCCYSHWFTISLEAVMTQFGVWRYIDVLTMHRILQPSKSFVTYCCRRMTTVPRPSPLPSSMSAWQLHEYGSINQLKLSSTVPMPVISRPHDVLVRIHAASVNPVDVMMVGRWPACILYLSVTHSIDCNRQKIVLLQHNDFTMWQFFSIYRVVQETVPQFYFCDNFRKCTPILTIFSLLEPEIYDA